MISKIINFVLIACFTLLLASCVHTGKYSFEAIGRPNYAFQSGNFTEITKTYEEAAQLGNKDAALWYNNLGSIYITKGDYDKALDSLLRAHYIMNDVAAFKEFEHRAVRLTGAESSKAYKGDPYEKAMNSLYTGLLLYNIGDLENARAAFKTGILADSDSEEEVYKSDIAVLYLLASRISKKLGDESLSNDYCSVVTGLYSSPDYHVLGFNEEFVKEIMNLKNNVLLVVECGEGPYKSRSGQYGELAVINGDRYEVDGLNIKIDGKVKSGYQIYSNTDVYFQANTRGGRKMDGILKGKAVFKKNASDTSKNALNLADQLVEQMNRTSDPYARGILAGAAGVSMLFSGGAAIMSGITNPKADIRHWMLLPEHIIIFPLSIPPGKHKIDIGFNDGGYSYSGARLNHEFDVVIKEDKDNVIFKRILKHHTRTDSNDFTSNVGEPGDSPGMDYTIFNSLVDKGIGFRRIEYLLGAPLEKSRDSSGREVWFYQSDKPGYSNSIYFVKGKVSEVKNELKQLAGTSKVIVVEGQEVSSDSVSSKPLGNIWARLFPRSKAKVPIFILLLVSVIVLVKLFIKKLG